MYYAASRTNWFATKDLTALQAAMAAFNGDVTLHEGQGENVGKVMLSADHSDEGTFPSARFVDGECVEVDFEAEVAEHLADGEILVLISAGHDKLRYVGGWAVACDNTGKRVELSLTDIYERAEQTFGKRPSPAEH